MGVGASRRSECRSPSATANWSTLGSHKVEPAGLLKMVGVLEGKGAIEFHAAR
jgi:hypothetical protein